MNIIMKHVIQFQHIHFIKNIRSRAPPPPKFKSPMVVELDCWLSAHTHELVGCLNLMYVLCSTATCCSNQ